MSDKSKSSNTENGSDPLFEAAKDLDLERKVDAMLSFDEPAPAPVKNKIEVSEPAVQKSEVPVLPEVTTEPASALKPTPIVVTDASEVSGAPVLPVNKTSAFKKKIAVTDHEEPEKAPLPADDELEPFETLPTPDPEEDLALTETEPVVTDPLPALKPIEMPRAPVSQLPEPSDSLGLDSAGTSRAVDEIIAAEADELLISRDKGFDEQLAATHTEKPKKQKGSRKFKKLFIKLLVLALLIGGGVASAIPASRYAILNAAGVRVSSSLMVIDDSTGQPLKNVDFSINDTSAKTDAEGNATLSNLKLGKSTMTIKKPAYAQQSQSLTLGWGSNPLGNFKLKAVGSQYTIIVTDFLSKKPIAKVDATSGEANGRSDDQGKIVLAMPQSDSDTANVQITIDGYRNETLKLDLTNTKDVNVSLVPSRKQAFISKRTGTFDLFKIDIDGKNEEKVLSGTGKESSESIALAAHPSKNIVALVSNRSAGTNTLTMVNLDDNSSTTITQSSRIQLVNWVGDKLIYVKVNDNEADASQKRHTLVSYDINAKTERELATTNYFNDVIVANGSVYYSPAAYQVNGTVGLYKINPDGNYRKSIFDKEVWNLFRTSYDKLSVSIGDEWFDLTLDTDTMTKAASAPASQKSRTYLDSPDGKTSLWTEDRDGKGTLISYDKTTKVDKVIMSQSGLKDPIEWIDATHIIYRVSSTSEIADYVFSTEGGQPQKIKDVTDTAGIDRWYFY